MNTRPIVTILITLALISTVYLYLNTILPNIQDRVQLEDKIIANQSEPPYQYRILEPALSALLNSTLLVSLNRAVQHIVFSLSVMFAVFMLIYILFHALLQRFGFTPDQALIGMLLLAVTIPLTVSGYAPDGDYLTLLFYVVGFMLIVTRHDLWLPLLIGVATLDREQAVFLVVFYLAYHARALNRRTLAIAAASVIMAALAFLAVRFAFGFRPSQYTIQLHIAHNTDPQNLIRIIPLWLAEVGGFAVLCLSVYKRSAAFLKISLAALVVYVILFALNGNLWELAKFLPAYLILIPMSLQAITGTFIHLPAASHRHNSSLRLHQTRNETPAARP